MKPENYCYYILPNAVSSEKDTLTAGVRIVAIPTSWPMHLHPTKSEGPFLSLRYLLEGSKMYDDLKKQNSRRAHKIIQQENIIKAQDYILIPKGESYEFDFVEALEHSMKGEVKNNELKGVHFFNEKNIKIVEELDSNEKGVWTAIIEKIDKNGIWVRKKNPSTFFPKNWSAAKTISEIMFAEKNKIQKDDKVYKSFTSCGIEVEIIMQNGKRKTIYPIL